MPRRKIRMRRSRKHRVPTSMTQYIPDIPDGTLNQQLVLHLPTSNLRFSKCNTCFGLCHSIEIELRIFGMHYLAKNRLVMCTCLEARVVPEVKGSGDLSRR